MEHGATTVVEHWDETDSTWVVVFMDGAAHHVPPAIKAAQRQHWIVELCSAPWSVANRDCELVRSR
jgi:hypothetical protein